MSTALLYGFLASSGLLIGMLVGLFTSPPRRLVAFVVAFGSGILVSTLTFDLMDEAFKSGSATYVVVGFLAGAVLYVAINAILDYLAAPNGKEGNRKTSCQAQRRCQKHRQSKQAALLCSSVRLWRDPRERRTRN
jgi:ZIP family zinc transporter